MSGWADDWSRLVRAAAREAVGLVGDELLTTVKANTPVRSGRLRSAWRIDPAGGDARTLTNETEYAAVVEYGSLGRIGARMAGRSVGLLQGRLGQVFEAALSRELSSGNGPGETDREVDR